MQQKIEGVFIGAVNFVIVRKERHLIGKSLAESAPAGSK
jgi:hypothetical protein